MFQGGGSIPQSDCWTATKVNFEHTNLTASQDILNWWKNIPPNRSNLHHILTNFVLLVIRIGPVQLVEQVEIENESTRSVWSSIRFSKHYLSRCIMSLVVNKSLRKKKRPSSQLTYWMESVPNCNRTREKGHEKSLVDKLFYQYRIKQRVLKLHMGAWQSPCLCHPRRAWKKLIINSIFLIN